MRTAFEYEVVQNTALAALAIHAATLQHHLAAAIPNGVPIPELMLVLPIALHQPSRVTVAGKVFEGSFYKAIRRTGRWSPGYSRACKQWPAKVSLP